MTNQNRVLVVDAGNTSIKVACFVDDELTEVQKFESKDPDSLKDWLSRVDISPTIVASVLSKHDTDALLRLFENPILVNVETDFPFSVAYLSKNTLGIDRICNIAQAFIDKKTGFAVTIDIGTCIKFDVINADNQYLGGSISPGIDLRYKSLHDYTGNLPLISNKSMTNLVGNDTSSCIHSGVINGMTGEIQQLMKKYEDQYSDLTFFVTGGDARFFDLESKNDIFADENLTIKGLFQIYKYNA